VTLNSGKLAGDELMKIRQLGCWTYFVCQ